MCVVYDFIFRFCFLEQCTLNSGTVQIGQKKVVWVWVNEENIRIKFVLLLKFRGVYIYSLMSMSKRVFSESDVFES